MKYCLWFHQHIKIHDIRIYEQCSGLCVRAAVCSHADVGGRHILLRVRRRRSQVQVGTISVLGTLQSVQLCK